MRSLPVILAIILVGACARPSATPQYTTREADPMYQEIKQNVAALSDCYAREAQSPSVKSVDLDTAALAVFGKCAAERQRHKAFSARNTPESIPQFEQRWRMEEQNDLSTIKQMLAVVRTSR